MIIFALSLLFFFDRVLTEQCAAATPTCSPPPDPGRRPPVRVDHGQPQGAGSLHGGSPEGRPLR